MIDFWRQVIEPCGRPSSKRELEGLHPNIITRHLLRRNGVTKVGEELEVLQGSLLGVVRINVELIGLDQS